MRRANGTPVPGVSDEQAWVTVEALEEFCVAGVEGPIPRGEIVALLKPAAERLIALGAARLHKSN